MGYTFTGSLDVQDLDPEKYQGGSYQRDQGRFWAVVH